MLFKVVNVSLSLVYTEINDFPNRKSKTEGVVTKLLMFFSSQGYVVIKYY